MAEQKAGLVLRASGKDGPQRIRVKGKWWTPQSEGVFLDHLAASCNVAWAAAQCGFSAVTVYNHRRTDAAFAQKWREALDEGYIRLETELLGTATDYVERLREDPELPLKHMSVREAISLLRRHGGPGGNPSARGGRFQARPRSLEEVRDSILEKLESIEAARRAEARGKTEDEPDGEA
ncbi:MAG: hypothetical protein J7500_08655 [Sphingomonas sp.]|uniref:hypothetical protein n=1 Tax=Sphingomonas sp. TaxID=28214 RepID=UPI001B1E2E54|nr:hypothetical protein [Sphingomonas sp.]MBO9622769.1 hypothetical protein [Sphingomonas sp.]